MKLPYHRKENDRERDLSVRLTLIHHKSFLKLLQTSAAAINESPSILIGGRG